MIPMTFKETAKAVGSSSVLEGSYDCICTDTRKITPGCLFIAIKGENFDGHDFAQKAIEAPAGKIRAKVLSMLSMVGLLDKYKSNPKEMSGGEQQRVAIARALINNPAILLADEPTGNLDEANSWEIMKLLESANERGTTVVVVTHNMDIVRAMRRRTITIDNGEVVSDVEEGGVIYEI